MGFHRLNNEETYPLSALTREIWPTSIVSGSAHCPAFGRSGRWWKVALVVALLCISGNPAALRPLGHDVTYAVAASLLMFAILLRRSGRGVRAFVPLASFVPVASVFLVLSVVHAYAFDFFPIITVAGFLTRLFIGMAVVIIVSDFVRVYVVAMVGLSMLSFVFWIPEYIALRFGAYFHRFFTLLANRLGPQTDVQWSLGFHSYLIQPGQMHRNAGLFWEPGAFAGYIIIALLMLAAIRSSFTPKQHMVVLCILTAALLTTFSTTGYLAYPIALLLNCEWRGVNRRHKASAVIGICVFALVVLFLSSYAFSKLDFLQTKIGQQITAVERRQGNWRTNRIGTLVFDWMYISERPLTGWGINFRTRFVLTPWAVGDSYRMGNGMSNFLANFGFIGFGTFLLCLSRGAYHISEKSRGYVLGFIASILLVLQGEPFLNYPLFLGLMFLSHASVMGQRVPKLQLTGSSSPVQACRRFSLRLPEM